MDLQDPATLNTFMSCVEAQWTDQPDDPGRPGWIEQVDDQGGFRVLLGVAKDLSFERRRLRVFKVQMSGHHTSPIYYVFSLKGPGDTCSRTAHYVLSHQRSPVWREWFCDTTARSVPFLGRYDGDLSLVGTRFRAVSLA